MNIEHADDNCTGSWSLVRGEIVCRACGKRYAYTRESRIAAVDENLAAELLERAAEQGAKLLWADNEFRSESE